MCLPCSAAHVDSAAVCLGGTDAVGDRGVGGIGGSVGAAWHLLMPLAAGDWQLRLGSGHSTWGGVDFF